MMDADHSTVCKPSDKTKDTYVYVRSFIERRVEWPEDLLPAIAENQVREVIAMLGRMGDTTRAAQAGLEWAVILELARRQAVQELARQQALMDPARQQTVELGHQLKHYEGIDVIDQMRRGFANAARIAADVIAKGQGGTEEDAFVEGVLKQIAEMTKQANFDGGTKAVDEALAEVNRQDQDRRRTLQSSQKALLEAGVKLDLLRRDPFAVAKRVEAIAALEATGAIPSGRKNTGSGSTHSTPKARRRGLIFRWRWQLRWRGGW